MTQVYSHWHHALEAFKHKQVLMRSKQGVLENARLYSFNPAVFGKVLEVASKFQRYVFTERILQLAFEQRSRSSVKDLIEAGITDLPFNAMTIEFKAKVSTGIAGKEDTVHQDEEPTFVVLTKFPKDEYTHRAFWFSMPELQDGSRGLLVCPLVLDLKAEVRDGEPAVKAESAYASWITDEQVISKRMGVSMNSPLISPEKNPWWHEMNDMGAMLTSCMLLLNTRGVEKEVIEAPSKLNKARIASGKAPILDYTVVRVGNVYTRTGEAIKYNSATGRIMPIHLRSGHVRRQHHGPKNEKIKMVYIQPVLVNYDPTQEPTIKPRVVK